VYILVVDDERPVATMLADAVSAQGHEASVAFGGQEALALWRQRHPDAVFLDLRMPRISGLDVLRTIRATDPDLPVVIITGHATSREREAARRLGVTDVIGKSVGLIRLTLVLAIFAPTSPGGPSPTYRLAGPRLA
jgi:CheY-like chemotaxis protein